MFFHGVPPPLRSAHNKIVEVAFDIDTVLIDLSAGIKGKRIFDAVFITEHELSVNVEEGYSVQPDHIQMVVIAGIASGGLYDIAAVYIHPDKL